MIDKSCGVYIVRLWLEPSTQGPDVWRASATDTASNERHYFASPDALSSFLLERGVSHALPEANGATGER